MGPGWLLFLWFDDFLIMNVRVESFRLDDLSEFLHRRKSHIEAAMRKAARSTIILMRSYVVDALRSEFKVPFKEFSKFRMRMRVAKNGMNVSLWVGSEPVLVQYLRPRESKGGFTAGGRSYPRAFMPWKSRGKVLIFEREGAARLPIRKASVDVDDIVLRVIGSKWNDIEGYFMRMTRRYLEDSEK